MGIATAPPLRGRGSPAWTSKVSGRMLPPCTAARSIGTDAVRRSSDAYSSVTRSQAVYVLSSARSANQRCGRMFLEPAQFYERETDTQTEVAGCTGSGQTAAHAPDQALRARLRQAGGSDAGGRAAARRSLAFGAPPVGARARQRLHGAPGVSQAGVAGADRGPAAVGALRPLAAAASPRAAADESRARGHSGDGERAGGEGGGQRARPGPGPARLQPAGSGPLPLAAPGPHRGGHRARG